VTLSLETLPPGDPSGGVVYQIVMKIFYNIGKGKAIPLQAWTDPEGSRRLRLPDFKTIST
jgi:hypothetical protein